MKPLAELEKELGYKFKNPKLLQRALTHRSYGAEHNERLEFLGDSVLNLVIGNALFKKEDHFDEGSLSRTRSNLVCQDALYEVGEKLNIPKFLNLGEGEFKSNGGHRPSIMGDAVEAIFGAIFTDSNYETVEKVILNIYAPVLSTLKPAVQSKDPKSLLQEELQAHRYALPVYSIINTFGAQHDQTFEVEAYMEELGLRTRGVGKSKRAAEQEAATIALQKLKEMKDRNELKEPK